MMQCALVRVHFCVNRSPELLWHPDLPGELGPLKIGPENKQSPNREASNNKMKIETFVEKIVKIGQNSRENWNLIENSNQNYIWLHLDSFPSCHVVIEDENPMASC